MSEREYVGYPGFKGTDCPGPGPTGPVEFKEACPAGIKGLVGPNDMGYAVANVRKAGTYLSAATGHLVHGYGFGTKSLPSSHPIICALEHLAVFDRENCCMMNKEHDPSLFEPSRGSEEAQAPTYETFDRMRSA